MKKSLLWRIVRFMLLLYLVSTLYGCMLFNHMMYPVPPPGYQDNDQIIKLETSNGKKISACYMKKPGSSWTILYSHGNGEDLGHVMWRAEHYLGLNVSCLVYDYQGYGTSEGNPSEKNTYADIIAAYEYLTQTANIPPEQIIAHGFSLGGGPALELAIRKKVGGIILESTFISAYRVLTVYPVLPFDKYKNLKKIKKVQCPILIVHGTNDSIVPLWHGQALYRMAREPKSYYWVQGGQHNTHPASEDQKYWDTIKDFIYQTAN